MVKYLEEDAEHFRQWQEEEQKQHKQSLITFHKDKRSTSRSTSASKRAQYEASKSEAVSSQSRIMQLNYDVHEKAIGEAARASFYNQTGRELPGPHGGFPEGEVATDEDLLKPTTMQNRNSSDYKPPKLGTNLN